ncbi:MAG TPA: S-adenosylmethionine:tRNA ribosyltransferase-isomerase, partial [Acidiphilium sp.]
LDRIRTAYAHAVDTGYRFYSYGDACLLEKA